MPDQEIKETQEGAETTEIISTNENNDVQTTEDIARASGWKPKEEYAGDPAKWVSAETFVAKGELIERIESLGKKLKDSEKTIKLLTEHHNKVKESEFKRAVEFLKQQKKQAYESGDVDKIIELDDKIAEIKETQKAQKDAFAEDTKGSGVDPAFTSWVSENKWYDINSEMKADADAFGEAYYRNNPEKTPAEVLEFVTKKIKKAYPEVFQNQNRNRPSAVEGGTNGGRANTKKDNFDLTDEERSVMRTFVKQGVMTEDEYISQLKSIRGA